MCVDEVEAIIRDSFEGRQYPDELVRGGPFGIDLELVSEFSNRRWDALANDIPFLIRHADVAFLTVEALCYFLPAYLIACVRSPDKMRETVMPSILFVLCPPAWAPEVCAFADEVRSCLTGKQRAAVGEWIICLIEIAPDAWELNAPGDEAKEDQRLLWR